ncbi:MAG: hypothetical protein AAF226_07190 [Verrucomicrobiota bacterium]
MTIPKQQTPWPEIFEHFAEQDLVVATPITEVTQNPISLLIRGINSNRDDALEGFYSGLDHANVMVAAHCIIGIRDFCSIHDLKPDEVREHILKIESKVCDRKEDFKYLNGSFAFRSTLAEIA